MRILCLSSTLLSIVFVASACGPGVSGQDKPDAFNLNGIDGGTTGETCTPGTDQPRCDGPAYETCNSDGTWHNVQTCDTPNVCVATLGCAECDPSVGLGCNANGDSYNCDSTGHLTTIATACNGMGCVDGECQTASTCDANGVKLVYVVDESNNLYSFDPSNGNTFTQVNTLNCPNPGMDLTDDTGETPATPFSMGIDHNGTAWVLYSSGKIFNVDVTTNNSPCNAMSPAWAENTGGYQLFGMGFVADSPGATTEKLYIAGGAASDLTNMIQGNIGAIDPTTLTVATVGAVPTPEANTENSPELTGTGDSLLYGYYPGLQVNYVVLYDQSMLAGDGSVTVKQTWDLPTLGDPDVDPDLAIVAWAFAHYGGKLYAFVTTADVDEFTGDLSNEDSQVYVLDPSSPTNKGTLLLDNTNRVIVGAGVSTCAPITVN